MVERSIRPIALNRKNALFAGSDGGAEHWAVIPSLIETCKLNGVEPLGYLPKVLTRIVNDHPNSQIDELLPWAFIRAPELRAVACEDLDIAPRPSIIGIARDTRWTLQLLMDNGYVQMLENWNPFDAERTAK